jgi:alanyl-tRNA synthetase
MKTDEIRDKYLEFFRQKGHSVCASDVLVPKWDPTVLFTPAGMNPFKDHFLGKVKLEFTRATSCQKCLRTGDIENVGRTAYHHTFFEMLGNFSFGDYFKREAIHWAWEFLTHRDWMNIDPVRLTVSVYLDDDEAAAIWQNEIGLPSGRIARMGEHDNFWPAGAPTDGPDGVCGPCSEIFFHPDNGPECEIWNLVFTQFNRCGDPPDNLKPLPSNNIDTGMGLERMAAVMQGVETNFHIDSLRPIVEAAAQACQTKYDAKTETGRRLRRIADHVRACTMAIHENVYPDKNRENYVIRRLLRRSVLQGYELGLREPFLHQIVPVVVEMMKRPYPQLATTTENVMRVIRTEEEGFFRILETGMEQLNRVFADMESGNSRSFDGRLAFDLYQEQGIPAELIESLAASRGLSFDRKGYDEAAARHAAESGAGEVGVMGDFGPIDSIRREVKSTAFTGYENRSGNARVVGLVSGDQVAGELAVDTSPQAIVLDATPFYATSGGQVADIGTIQSKTGSFMVTSVEKSGEVLVHYGAMTKGTIRAGDAVVAEVDSRRRDGIERAHTATHILHFALQTHLGKHAQQRGSRVEDDQLRFDFANPAAVPAEQLLEIERETLARVAADSPVRADLVSMKVAHEKGAMMLFGEKYPDPVRMVSIGDYSKELCGGTHVTNTARIGGVELIAEEALSAGTRRITMLTGEKARAWSESIVSIYRQLETLLGPPREMAVNARNLLDEAKALRKQVQSGKAATAPTAKTPARQPSVDAPDYRAKREAVRQVARALNTGISEAASRLTALKEEIESLSRKLTQPSASSMTAAELDQRGVEVAGVRLIVSEVPNASATQLRDLTDQIRKSNPNAAVFLATIQDVDKVLLVAGVGAGSLRRGLNAGDWVKSVAPTVGGGGGGKPDFAQAGGKEPDKIHVALAAAREYVTAVTAT